ncbi:SSO2 protein [Xylariaceae sp. FL1651]|nr:SSO2 protein [Xylariaceae sp. FL1651]
MSYGYGGRQNPFDQRDDAGRDGYGGGLPSRPDYRNQGPSMGSYDGYGSNNVEMAPLAQNAESFSAGNPNSTLDEISEINRGIDTIDRNLEQLRMLQQRALDDPDSSASSSTNRQLDRLSSETMAQYRTLTERVRQLKSNPQNQQRFGQQVRRVDGRLKEAIQAYTQVESSFRKKTQDQMARQFRIVRPEATEDEVRAAVEDQTGGQVFQQALMQSNRRGQAQSVLNAVQDRHAQLQKIEQQMIELAQLFQDIDTLIVQQDVAVTTIEQKGEEVVDNLDKGNVEISTAVNTARATRKKKWICLGIVGMLPPNYHA